MRTITTLAMLASALLVTACNTVHGAGEDAKSVGRVFSHDPDGNRQNHWVGETSAFLLPSSRT